MRLILVSLIIPEVAGQRGLEPPLDTDTGEIAELPNAIRCRALMSSLPEMAAWRAAYGVDGKIPPAMKAHCEQHGIDKKVAITILQPPVPAVLGGADRLDAQPIGTQERLDLEAFLSPLESLSIDS